MRGIKTIINGVRFRSRLEAKWAIFFDLLGWRWEYEPYDLNGYIPDFILIGKKRTTLVEVKPFESLNQFIPSIEKYNKSIKETDHLDKEILLLGVSPLLIDNCSMGEHLGWMDEKTWWTDEAPEERIDFKTDIKSFNDAVFNCYNSKFGFINSLMSYEDRITGLYEGDHYVCPADREQIKQLWAIAVNGARYDKF